MLAIRENTKTTVESLANFILTLLGLSELIWANNPAKEILPDMCIPQ
jgi:hypothetical protein